MAEPVSLRPEGGTSRDATLATYLFAIFFGSAFTSLLTAFCAIPPRLQRERPAREPTPALRPAVGLPRSCAPHARSAAALTPSAPC